MAKKEAKKQDRTTEYTTLPNGCKFTPPYINPANWESSKASVKKPWFIKFSYHDPVRGIMEVKWRAGNKYKTLPERQDAARQLLTDTKEDLARGLNPFIGKVDPTIAILDQNSPSGDFTEEQAEDMFLTAESHLSDCIKWAFDQYDDETGTKKDMRSYMHYITPSLMVLRFDKLPVKDITPQHILKILSAASKITSRWDEKKKKDIPLKWNNYKYNRIMAYLSMLFKTIGTLKIITANPCTGLVKKAWGKKPKVALTEKERIAIDRHLKQNEPGFHRFIQIFYASGSRMVEMMKVKARDVYIEQDTFYRWVRKGKAKIFEQVPTTIPGTVLHLWRDILKECSSPDDYLFSRGFKPGVKPIAANNINIYWAELVQQPLGVKQGPYILKSMYLTELKKKYGSSTAATHAAHKSNQMVDRVYDLDKEATDHERIKRAELNFLPAQAGLPAGSNCATLTVPSFLLPPPPPRTYCKPCSITRLEPLQQLTVSAAA